MGSSSLALDFLKLSSQLRDGHGAPTLFYGAVLAGLEEATAEQGHCRIVVRVGQELCHFGKSAHGGALGEPAAQGACLPERCTCGAAQTPRTDCPSPPSPPPTHPYPPPHSRTGKPLPPISLSLAAASLIDIVTSAAVLTLKPAAISLHLSTSYIGMAPLGCRLVCEAQARRQAAAGGGTGRFADTIGSGGRRRQLMNAIGGSV